MRIIMKEFFLIALFIFITTFTFSDDSKAMRATLEGLKAFYVRTSMVGAIDGITIEKINKEVESQLMKAGINVIDDKGEDKLYTSNEIAILNVEVVSIESKTGLAHSIGLRIEVVQNAQIRNLRNSTVASTWSIWNVGIIGKNKTDAVRDGVKDFVDKFINAYFSFNKSCRI